MNADGQSCTVTLADGAAPADLNAGVLPESGTGSINGTVWEDLYGSGIVEGNDFGMSGVPVQLIDPNSGTVLQTATTDANGDYSFGSLVSGTYTVNVETYDGFTHEGMGLPPALGSVFDPTTGTASVTVASGQAVAGIDAGLIAPEQFTFTLPDGTAGSISYTLPWGSVDPSQSSQNISLSDLDLTIDGQSFAEGTADFTTTPTLQYSYGNLTGLHLHHRLLRAGPQETHQSQDAFRRWEIHHQPCAEELRKALPKCIIIH